MINNKNIIELKNYTVEVITSLTWGEKEDIQASVISSGVQINKDGGTLQGKNIVDYKIKIIETLIKKIVDKDGVEIPFSIEWLRGLDVQDGDTLYSAGESLIVPKA